MARNIVVCCDGTGNEYGTNRTNVIKLHATLVQDASTQVAFYDPGVGTFSIRPMITRPGLVWQKVLGLAFGVGLRENVMEAYRFLVDNVDEGDRIFIFGFSRGAYTARVVAALLRGVGILRPECVNLIPYALRYIEIHGDDVNWQRLNGFRNRFGSGTKPGQVFVGVWDTVSSVSWAWDRFAYLFTAKNDAVDVIRHAVSIDERRAFFRTNLWSEPEPEQDFKQVWFAGVHCDVGGGNPDPQSSLSQLALEWMLCEARDKGLLVDAARAREELARGSVPDPVAPMNPSLKGAWWIGEFVPRLTYAHGRRTLRVNRARRRFIPEGMTVHESVQIRRAQTGYAPPNLPRVVEVEPWRRFDGT